MVNKGHGVLKILAESMIFPYQRGMWIVFALLTRFFWACCNLLDQYITRSSGHHSVLALLILENLVILPSIIVMLFIVDHPFSIQPQSLIWIAFGVIANISALFPYLLALKTDDARNAVPFFELTPVILMVLAWVVFGDSMTAVQMAGVAIIVISGFLFSWDFSKSYFKLRTALLVGLSAVLYGLYQLALRYGAHNESIGRVTLFVSIGLFLGGVLIFFVVPYARHLFIESVQRSRGKILLIALGNDILSRLALLSLVIAFALAPGAGFVGALSASQPVFVLILTVLMSFWRPDLHPRVEWNKDLKIKMVLMLVMGVGAVLLNIK